MKTGSKTERDRRTLWIVSKNHRTTTAHPENPVCTKTALCELHKYNIHTVRLITETNAQMHKR
jgi:hypothetical protein